MLIAEYLLREKTKTGTMPENPALVKTIVTTNMADVMTKAYNVKEIEVLTGFKYIGEQIKLFEQNHTYNYVFGLEESYGCLAGTHARDKDAVVAVMCLCEVAAYCKKNGITLWDQMLKIYEEYGYFKGRSAHDHHEGCHRRTGDQRYHGCTPQKSCKGAGRSEGTEGTRLRCRCCNGYGNRRKEQYRSSEVKCTVL